MEKETFIFMVVQVDNLNVFLGNKTMDKVPNARRKELCGVTKPVDKRIDEWVM